MTGVFNILAAGEAEATSGIAALGFDPKAFLIQLITFVLAYLVLRRYAFGPILDVLQKRRETIESSVKLTEKLQAEELQLEAKVEKTLHEARAKADEIISAANDSARVSLQEAEDSARAKTEGILTEAHQRIAQDTAVARQKLEAELVGLVSDATEAIIAEKVDGKKDAALISRALKASRN